MRAIAFFLCLFLSFCQVQADVQSSHTTENTNWLSTDSIFLPNDSATIANDSVFLPSDSIVLNYLREVGVPVSDNNHITLLKSGEEKFIDLFEAIRQAKHHIHLEYFNFRNDSIANALFDLLAVKAKEGVEVRALFDAFGNWSNDQPLKKKHLRKIRQQGIEIVKFDPFKFPYINHAIHRDHRKIVVIDGKVAYTGGMNIADYYIKGLPAIGEWRDMHMRIEGDVVNTLQEIFLTMWNKETKQHIGGEAYFPLQQSKSDERNMLVAIVDRTPRKTPWTLGRAYAKSIEEVQDNINIITPYYVPTKIITKALKRTLKKGIQVTIMVSSASDIPFTPEAALYKLHKLMKKGAHVFLYNGGFHHSKIMMVDNRFCTVGTANLNSRSLRYDYETNAFIFNREVTEELNEMFAEDLKNCTPLTPEYWKKRSAWKKFVGWFANLLGPFM